MHCLIPLLVLLGPAQMTDFEAGFAEADVTPKLGMEQPGGYGKVFHQSFHDACKARAAVFRHNGTTVALVGLDALGIDRRSVLRVREQIQTKCGIPGPNILIGASHSHSSGPVGMVMPGDYDHSDTLVRKLAYDDSSMADLKYLETMEAGIVDAVCKAHSRLSVSTAAVGKGLENQVAFNRRFRMKNGMTMTHPGQNNPDILEPATPAASRPTMSTTLKRSSRATTARIARSSFSTVTQAMSPRSTTAIQRSTASLSHGPNLSAAASVPKPSRFSSPSTVQPSQSHWPPPPRPRS